MDPSVIAAMAKWPNVPDCRGWLSLDRRGQWRLQNSPVVHAGLSEFIGRNYECNSAGEWFMQNGPQRVWVELATTPWVLRLNGGNTLTTHSGLTAASISAAWLVDGENLCFKTEHGLGLIDDRDLASFLEHIRTPHEHQPLDDLLSKTTLELVWQGTTLPLQHCRDADLPEIGRFKRQP